MRGFQGVNPKLLTLLAGAGLLTALFRSVDFSATIAEIFKAGWSLPAITLWSLCQFYICACAWREIVGARKLARRSFLRLRLIREAVNTFLPVAQIGGPIAAAIELKKMGVGVASAGAGTIADVGIEAAAQVVFLFMGLCFAGAMGAHAGFPGALIGGVLAIVGGMIAAARLRGKALGQCVLRALIPLIRFSPGTIRTIRAIRLGLMQIRRCPRAIAKAGILHLLAWVMSAGEAYLVLATMHAPVGAADALVLESLTAAARAAGFAIPAALGIQEAGLVFSAGLLGIPPETAIALSLVKRAREILIGILGLLLWQLGAIRDGRWPYCVTRRQTLLLGIVRGG
jgi:putative membrane protein